MKNLDSNQTEMAEILYSAYQNGHTIAKDQIPAALEKNPAYAIQHAVTANKTSKGQEELKGYKISLTSKETQNLFQSETPLYGALTTSALSNGVIELDSLSSPLIEIELIFIAKEDLSAADDVHALLEKTQVAPGIEVPDSRFDDWFPKITLGQVIADSAVAGKIITGLPQDNIVYSQLENLAGTLTLDGKEIAAGSSSEVLDHPIHAVKWLANELAEHGLAIKKGMAISSGTFILPKPLEKGLYEASYGELGSVTLTVE
ncbi:2-keto-4-pentenoate hydratase [Planomicrobium stackebrandtii]|uniref:2-keto-4-pentenoate hydratase n=1 Tax=Planomicrobium stackebrandtii TaxID=253160 RepID=A0ABU0GXE0_9BACL|nr:hypothetical protein [Planomicrobium stackebrandtii]MDQ0429743.1 2-keto-4-pentenoate hydratase [Planomicrobium stackebrandtii]